ncbi:CHAT domain-containing protein [Roridomyces roridus]|uniref:CHAT domain-containing protein n=1 Tax=Roridomyces roridus TaxID=1738132 RepID=A0AAD7B8W1_9AGAR|nr:CHAT domain-containing protein [Roridomyces roridus]
MDALMERDPRCANELLFLSSQLERLGNIHAPSSWTPQPSQQSIAAQAYRAAERRQTLIQEIRQLEGFERFSMPKTISELSSAAQGGHVVIINVTDTQCDALVLHHGPDCKVIHIPLDLLNKDLNAPVGLSKSFQELVGRNIRLSGMKEGQLTTEDGFKNILSTLWFDIVKPVLNGLAFNGLPTIANKPRIWWCLTGPLVFLPIHAAGIYSSKESTIGSKVSDYVISSYTPSLTALIEGYRRNPVLHKGLQVLAVAQPAASGRPHIPGTKTEINHIQNLAQTRRIPVVTLYEHIATVERVQEEMQKSQWAHFACHGVQDVTTPTASALLLAGDSRLTLADIIQLALPHANFAFLSACQTATGEETLQEESVHLAAGMLLAGYRGVIATMWTITDPDAPQVAKDVYEHLLHTSPPDPTKAAEALHLAVQNCLKGTLTSLSCIGFHMFTLILGGSIDDTPATGNQAQIRLGEHGNHRINNDLDDRHFRLPPPSTPSTPLAPTLSPPARRSNPRAQMGNHKHHEDAEHMQSLWEHSGYLSEALFNAGRLQLIIDVLDYLSWLVPTPFLPINIARSLLRSTPSNSGHYRSSGIYPGLVLWNRIVTSGDLLLQLGHTYYCPSFKFKSMDIIPFLPSLRRAQAIALDSESLTAVWADVDHMQLEDTVM